MDIDDADTLCFNQCQNDPFCKYSGWFQRSGTIIAGSGDCLIFHESDTLTKARLGQEFVAGALRIAWTLELDCEFLQSATTLTPPKLVWLSVTENHH
jgi:hypothetical protein